MSTSSDAQLASGPAPERLASGPAFEPHMRWPDPAEKELFRFCVREGAALVTRRSGAVRFPAELPSGAEHVLGSLFGRTCLAVDGTDHLAPPGCEWVDLRSLWGVVDELLWGIAGRAVQIVEWDRTHRHCGRCGTPTVPDLRERMRRCPRCDESAYPRVSPAVIVLITRGESDERALLAWGARRSQAFYSSLAGFVEAGESLEEAVRREIREEVGIEVDDITYFGSQPWPFPHQLMIGYRARYRSGELVLQETEIRDARWFTPAEVEEVVAVRGNFSISGWLIEGWIAEQAARSV
ncbi:MAG: NAD(+) diphosphatase [Solirubrobacterales bacterium]|nr:NAD(+) diphosphatase [Solirubrobacterales bacterium]